jgi:single-strand DNA-binding protein
MSKTNHVRLIGRIGQQPKLINSDNGTVLLSFSVATDGSYKDKQGVKQERTEWHNVTAFGNVAELINKFLNKGSKLMVLGYLRTRQYNDQAGVAKYTTEIIVEEVLFLDDKQKTE